MKTPGRKQTKKRREAIVIRHSFIAILSFTFILIMALFVSTSFVEASDHTTESSSSCVLYKSIQLESGDTLWSIAEEYMPDGFSSIWDYIEELKDINGLKSDEIHEGRYLTVVYCDTNIEP
ncbi:LysM peptidoglycan-binding domain-containing protein [Sporofaciens sp. SGI.106]|uniref:LysM peptidoglycan-binding domain-containing protein n=1 Tax=Sporofaciens sp. SGI.106 TaxID=3420568 RepID=UPI003D088571